MKCRVQQYQGIVLCKSTLNTRDEGKDEYSPYKNQVCCPGPADNLQPQHAAQQRLFLHFEILECKLYQIYDDPIKPV